MKTYLGLIMFLYFSFCVSSLFAQDDSKKYSSTFEEVFKNDNDRKNIQKLREYLYTRTEDLKKLKVEHAKYAKADSILVSYLDKAARLKNIISESNEKNTARSRGRSRSSEETDSLSVPQYLLSEVTESKEIVEKTRPELQRIITRDSVAMEDAKKDVAISNKIMTGIENAESDINKCRSTLDSLLAIELLTQSHKQKVSLYFIILIGALLGFFFLAFLSNKPIARILMGDYGLQFITIFVLIIAVVLFGVLGILQSSELAAILSGISGYILGKGRDGSARDRNPNPPEQAQK